LVEPVEPARAPRILTLVEAHFFFELLAPLLTSKEEDEPAPQLRCGHVTQA